MCDFQSYQLTRCAPSSQAWTICHLSRLLVWKSKRGDCASCSSTKNFSESRPVAPPELVDCVWTHRSHSRMIRGFALSCFIQRAPSEIGPFRSAGMAALGANDWETVFPNGKMRRNSRGIQEKTQTKRPPEGGLSVALMLTQFRLHGTHVPPPIILPSHPMMYSMRHQCGYVESKVLFLDRNQ
jgi:hypothetical protein